MNIKELRSAMDQAFREEQLTETRLVPKGPKAWALATGDLLRFFSPAPYRRSWGFVYGGVIGIEVPALRAWLNAHKADGEIGIFHTFFVCYHTANEEIFGRFMIEHGKPLPSDLWAGLICDRLSRIPSTLDELIHLYRRNREELGYLAHPHNRHAWDFLLKWREDPDPLIAVPKMLPNGRIV